MNNKANLEKTNKNGYNYFESQLRLTIGNTLKKYYNFPNSSEEAFNLPKDFVDNRNELTNDIKKLVHNFLEVPFEDIKEFYPSFHVNIK